MGGPDTLLEATLASSAAIVVVLLLRSPLRALFGARVAYGAWALVPASIAAMLLPPATVAGGGAALDVVPMAIPAVLAVPAASANDTGAWALALWITGAVVLAAAMALRQRRFRRALGRLRLRSDGARESEHAAEGLPATLGVLSPMVVVPADFDRRYDAIQRELMLAHERAHVQRGDVQANALAAALRCLFWFNPLVHVAAARFRHDQELACDALVLARHPDGRRRYGDALLEAQLRAQASPLGCHFGFAHPLRERIAMLREPLPSTPRRIMGASFVFALALGCAFAAWAAQPPQEQAAPVAKRDVQGVSLPAPEYPDAANEHNLNGNIVLLVDVAADGSVTDAVVERSEPAGVFDEVALEAVRNWKFNPAMEDGKPVAGRVRVPIKFESRPVEGEEAAPMVGAKNPDPRAYDWIRQDPSIDTAFRETMCDVIKLDKETGVSYCGILKK